MSSSSAAAGRGIFDRTPPQNLEAERSVLGAMLLNPDAVPTVIEILKTSAPTIFYHEPHQYIYDAVVRLFAASEPVDAVTILRKMQARKTLDKAGGAAYLAELTRAVPTSANVEHYAHIVLDLAIMRGFISQQTKLISQCYAGDTNALDILNQAEQGMLKLSRAAAQTMTQTSTATITEIAARMVEQAKDHQQVTGVHTGIDRLNHMLGGMQPADFLVLAARPSVGKTGLALHIARSAALAGSRVLVFSLEMSRESLIRRMLCAHADVDGKHLAADTLMARQQAERLPRAAQELEALPLVIDDNVYLDVMQMRSKARHQASREGLDLIVLDYLQLMAGDKGAESRQLQIAEISRAIKGLARELEIPVLALSQLSREADNGAPKLSHLRESGAIEQDADVVLMLERDQETLKIHVKKHRNGPVTAAEVPIVCHYSLNSQRIDGTEKEAPPPARRPVVEQWEGEEYNEDDLAF